MVQLYDTLILIVPRVWEIGSKQPCIKCQKNSATHFVYFEVVKLPPITHLEATSFHSKVKASTSEPLPYPLQAITKISTLYNFYEWRV